MAQQIVNSYTEWDPLEEVVVGRLAGGVFPSWQPSMRAVLSEDSVHLFQEREESPYAANDLFREGDAYTFGGSFHCVTLDVRRRGELGQFLN